MTTGSKADIFKHDKIKSNHLIEAKEDGFAVYLDATVNLISLLLEKQNMSICYLVHLGNIYKKSCNSDENFNV